MSAIVIDRADEVVSNALFPQKSCIEVRKYFSVAFTYWLRDGFEGNFSIWNSIYLILISILKTFVRQPKWDRPGTLLLTIAITNTFELEPPSRLRDIQIVGKWIEWVENPKHTVYRVEFVWFWKSASSTSIELFRFYFLENPAFVQINKRQSL